MKVVVLADIHGNLPALEAVLAEVSVGDADLLMICGDVASGPLPIETLDVLRTLPRARFVRGNARRPLADYSARLDPNAPMEFGEFGAFGARRAE
jgi:predicted phosphodiesterase